MRSIARLLPLCFSLAFGLDAAAFGLDIPKLQARVTDLAGLLAPEQAASLERKLQQFEVSDSTQIAVLIIPSLEGEALEDFSVRVANAWRLGQKERDNGAILLIAMKERKIRIEVGYGLESRLTDALSRRIIQNEIAPGFRRGEFFEGIDAGISAMMAATRGAYQASGQAPSGSRRNGSGGTGHFPLLFLVFPLLLVGSRSRVGGSLFGGGAGAYLGYSILGFSLFPLMLGGLLGGGAGFLLAALFRSAGRSTSSRIGRGFGGPFFPGGGGSSWGGFSGGSFGGGGFSGGGGSFGGGGASGSW